MATDLARNLARIRERIDAACLRAGRDPGEVRLVAVSKTVPAEIVEAGIEAGLTILGENYVQEAEAKIESIGRTRAAWHFIGRLQTNKARYAVRLFDLIHSVDSFKLARELDKRAAGQGSRQAVLVQVNVSGEATKGGTALDQAAELVDRIGGLPNLDLKGLMTMPPFFDQPDRARPYFASLRELKDRIGPPLVELSMGMSGDFEAAVEEGATLVRVGTALFGSRS
ncbi:MAG: YggS family pyridoxal phosphate-dependent enzyme [Proteobacteria bacterium]|nr:YggS family pyridoxal phosphate-dependent enzyme [Pseudomonadota bacterium]